MRGILIIALALIYSCAAWAQSSETRPLKSRIKGIWAIVGDENATFVIKDSTIFYPDQNGTYKYSLKGDSIKIKYEGFVGRFLIRMRGNDTLVTKGDEETVYFRFDNAEKLAIVKEFYTQYITGVANGAEQKKLEALQRKYCTAKLLNKIPKLIEQTDADPFLKAQDSDIGFLKTLTVGRDPKKEDQYITSYMADHKIVIHLIVVMTSNGYKIDGVW